MCGIFVESFTDFLDAQTDGQTVVLDSIHHDEGLRIIREGNACVCVCAVMGE